jgi:hypothetical protein
MLLGGGLPMMLLEGNRSLWLSGRPGGGKTALAVRMAYDLLNKGFCRYCISNIPLVFADRLEDVIPRVEGSRLYLDTVVILDEAGLYLKTGRDAEKFTAFVRKMNVVLILASVEEVANDFKHLIIERSFDARSIGFPLWVYSYFYSSRKGKESDRFFWIHPQEVFGLYDTGAMPVDDANISDFLQYWVTQAVGLYKAASPEWRQRAESWNGKRKSANDSLPALEEAGRSDVDFFMEASKNFESAASDISVSLDKLKRKRYR